MKRVAFERYLQRVKMTLGRDMDVQGVLHVGPVLKAPDDRADVREIDLLVVARADRVARYLDDLSWLPGAEDILATAAFGPNRRDVLFPDGLLVRVLAHAPDALPPALGPCRTLLDRGGVARTARALSSLRQPDRVPPLPGAPTADHAALLAWAAHLGRARGDGAAADRMADAALETAAAALADDPDAAERILSLAWESGASLLSGLAWLLGERFPHAAGPAALRKWIAAPAVRWTPDETVEPEPGYPAVGQDPPGKPVRDFVRGDGPDAYREDEPDVFRPDEPILAQDRCPFCGGTLASPGRLYVKGTLKDIRFLPGLSGTLDMKEKVVARPCTACGQISLRFQDD
jgi:hypothetical protein